VPITQNGTETMDMDDNKPKFQTNYYPTNDDSQNNDHTLLHNDNHNNDHNNNNHK
jgi:hypothetical protein